MNGNELQQNQPHGKLLTELLETPETGVRSILERQGTLQVVGSYALGLISQYSKEPDIDMNLLVPEGTDLVEAASEVGKELIGEGTPWHKYEVYDNRKPKRPLMPHSVYLGFKAYTPEVKVAADVWFFNQPELFKEASRNHEFVEEALALHPEYRDRIISIKDALAQEKYYASGFSVYRAVIEEGVMTADELKSLPEDVLARINDTRKA